MSTKRDAIIQGYRELADFLAAHPEIPIDPHTINVFTETREEFDALAQGFAGPLRTHEDFIVLRHTFAGGVITLDVNCDRELPDPTNEQIMRLITFLRDTGAEGDGMQTCADALKGDKLARRDCAKMLDDIHRAHLTP